MKITKIEELKEIAKKIRIDIIDEIYNAQSGHPGSSLSLVEILTVLYFNEMNIDPNDAKSPSRDRLVLSKGHAAPALYATLAERGYFPKEELKTLRQIDSPLQGHPNAEKLQGIDASTGSLGQGLSIANGMALASKMDEMGYRVYCIVGDGEIEEGQIWEACMTASKYKLDNLCLIVDANKLQLTESTENVKNIQYEDIEQKLRSFGFNTLIIDGNDIESVMSAFSKAEEMKEMPTAIIARTTKGKGVSFMENNVIWHGKAPNQEEYEKAISELNK